ncbi:MAG: DNA-deoxyinosine glycosylase [Clostridia bacterium]|nr:DNA-deoxyinosine glycosylase [Clostridia bacterium]
MTVHPIGPLYNADAKILILGSFPSVKSREAMFFYGHPQNRFWKVISAILSENEPKSVAEKKALILENHIALWDVIHSCEIAGSADSTIRGVTANDLTPILRTADIRAIFVNGKTAKRYYDLYIRDTVGREAICLPSTSPANAGYSLDRLTAQWRAAILPFLTFRNCI